MPHDNLKGLKGALLKRADKRFGGGSFKPIPRAPDERERPGDPDAASEQAEPFHKKGDAMMMRGAKARMARKGSC